jgi:HlyD family secretion protein
MSHPPTHEVPEDVDSLLGPEASSRWSRWRMVLALGLLAVAALVGYWLWQASATATVRYVTQPVSRGDLAVVVTATGSVQPTNVVEVSSELSGTVRSVLVDYNSPVEAGQVLAELDTDKLEASVASARARVAAARAQIAGAEATASQAAHELERRRTLAARQIISEHDLDVAEAAQARALAALESARAQLEVALAELRLNETELAKACICTPISGVVLQRNVDPGQTVAAALQAPMLFSIAEDLAQMEVQVDVDEADVGRVREGQAASFTVDAYPGRRFPAEIRDLRFAPETVSGVVTYKAVLTVDNQDLLLRPGMTATADIVVREVEDALLVPNAALRYQPAATDAQADRRGLLEMLMPGPPHTRAPTPPPVAGPARELWVLREGVAVPVEVVIGSSDGLHTDIFEAPLEPGDLVIVDEVAGSG